MTHMASVTEARSGKTHRDENFPVASRLVSPRHRAPILTFYNFVRAADDVADHPTLPPAEKLRLLDALEAALLGRGGADPHAEALRRVLAERGLGPEHALDLLKAFRQDVTKPRYADWGELIDYCALSAMPVGRFVLDVHGESRATWALSDPICAALQVINHLQDCAKDFRELDRVYIPADALAAAGIGVEALSAPRASPALRSVIGALAVRTDGLLDEGAGLPDAIAGLRLSLEIAAIHRLARHLVGRLKAHDPLSERVHHGKLGFALVAALGCLGVLGRRAMRAGAPRRAHRTAA
jgi:squalene synthase HpnC